MACTSFSLVVFVSFFFFMSAIIFDLKSKGFQLFWQAAQLAHMMEDRLKTLAEEAEKEKVLMEVAKATIREKGAALEAIEGRARESEGARTLAEQRAVDLEAKLGKIELRLAEAKSVISARDKEVVDLKVAVEERKHKFYDMGFADTKNSSESIMF